ncbi:MAG: tRNA 2-thiouridine(34) synthase MnmA [Pseudomonadota bacterium]
MNSLDLPGRPQDTRVVVAMSGGVDSSVVAGLLHREGYDVIGVTLQLYNHGEAVKKKGACCAGQDIHDARMVAERLGFPHYVLDYEERFREAVIEPFAAAYEAGETPIPCVSCNQTVKFVDLLDTARKLGADALATGHYIRARQHGNKRVLLRPIDDSRDQSYFLFATTQEQIDYVRFPLGGKTKTETRALAQELGIEIANKPDSQDICFVPQGKYSDVIAKLNPAAMVPGDVVHMDGRVLGHHDGIVNYTIGQRRGIGVSAGEPIYVVHLDRKSNRVIVGPKEALGVQRIWLRDVNWLGDLPLAETPDDGLPIFVKVRSTRPPAEARLFMRNGAACVDLVSGDAGVSPGQAAVFYEDGAADTRVLGGGWISRAEKDAQAEAAIAALLKQEEAA